jgi:hypothetical protein
MRFLRNRANSLTAYAKAQGELVAMERKRERSRRFNDLQNHSKSRTNMGSKRTASIIGVLGEKMALALFESNSGKRIPMVAEMMLDATIDTAPIRPGRKSKRKKGAKHSHAKLRVRAA